MKKFVAALLALLMILSASALAEDFDHILSLLENGQYDEAIREIERFRDDTLPDDHQMHVTSEPDYFGCDWGFPIHIENNWGVGVTLERLDILDSLDGEPAGGFEWSGDRLADIGLGGVFLGPGDAFDWGDGHPAADLFNSRQYVFSFRGDDGEDYVFVQEFLMNAQPAVEEAPPVPEENLLYNCTPPLTVGADWIFEIVIANIWNETLTLDSLAIIDLMDGEPVDAHTWSREQLGEIGLGEYVAEPSSAMGWNDAHPWVEYFNGRQYVFTLLSEDGTEYRIVREFDMTGSAPAPEAAPMGVEERSWTFGIGFLNETESVLTLYALDITNYLDGEPGDVFPFEGEALANIGLGGLMLQPGEPFSWMDAHPAVDWFNGRVYRFHF